MKRVKAACILQTLVFQQKDDSGLSVDKKLELNKSEVKKYIASLEKNRTRYKIVEENEESDGSVVVRIRKQYNDKAEVAEYFD